MHNAQTTTAATRNEQIGLERALSKQSRKTTNFGYDGKGKPNSSSGLIKRTSTTKNGQVDPTGTGTFGNSLLAGVPATQPKHSINLSNVHQNTKIASFVSSAADSSVSVPQSFNMGISSLDAVAGQNVLQKHQTTFSQDPFGLLDNPQLNGTQRTQESAGRDPDFVRIETFNEQQNPVPTNTMVQEQEIVNYLRQIAMNRRPSTNETAGMSKSVSHSASW